MAAKDKAAATEEPKQTLPVGHAKAGYVAPDLSGHDGTGTIPDEEKEWHEARNDARDEEVEAVEQGEDEAAKEEQKAQEELNKIALERAKYIETQKVGPTAGKLPGDASYAATEQEKAASTSSKAASS